MLKTENYRGWVAPEFHDLAMQFSRLQNARSQQGGAALAVYFQGQKVVDIYTGKKVARLKTGKPIRYRYVIPQAKVY